MSWGVGIDTAMKDCWENVKRDLEFFFHYLSTVYWSNISLSHIFTRRPQWPFSNHSETSGCLSWFQVTQGCSKTEKKFAISQEISKTLQSESPMSVKTLGKARFKKLTALGMTGFWECLQNVLPSAVIFVWLDEINKRNFSKNWQLLNPIRCN